ncbi:MAG TPA: response regulator transcription factor [Planctomycetota bacterium]|nr:response regulator transcription factor [Planctomycetota bacterium]
MTTAPTPLVLVVEDEPKIQAFLGAALGAHGYRVESARTAREALAIAALRPPDVVLLDLMLPDGSGVDVARQLRSWSEVPILVLSARGQETDKVGALDAGADDYLTKPFGVEELVARIRALLRRTARAGTEQGGPVFEQGGLRVDLARRQTFLDGEELRLTPIEWRLLAFFVQHAGKVLTHEQVLREVWGPPSVGETQYLRVYVGQLRRKLKEDPARPRFLRTEPGVGYRLMLEG